MWCVPALGAEYIAKMEDVLNVLARPHDSRAPVVALDERPVLLRGARRRCCMNTRCGWGGVARPSRDPPQEPHYGDEVEGSSQV